MGRCFSRLDNGVRWSRIGAQYLTTKKQPGDEQNNRAAGAVAIGFHGLLLTSGNLYHSIDAVFKLYCVQRSRRVMGKSLYVEDPARKSKIANPKIGNGVSRQSDSNRRPADYKSAALPAELCRRRKGYKVKTEAAESHRNFCTCSSDVWSNLFNYSRTREYAVSGSAVSRFLITVLR